MHPKLTLQEEQAMNAIWKVEEGSVTSILKELQLPQPPYTTLASTIKNLEKKGYVQSRRIGNTFLYKAAIDVNTYNRNSLSNLVKQHFGNSYKSLVAFFAEQKKISAADLKEIVNTIERKKK